MTSIELDDQRDPLRSSKKNDRAYSNEWILLLIKASTQICFRICTSHFSDLFLDECTYNGIFPFQEPSGTSDQVQALDLGIFGLQKRVKKSCFFSSFNIGDTEKEVISIVDSWRQTTTPRNVVSAFSQAGIYRKVCDGKVIMAADIKYARAVRGMSHEDAPECEFYNRTKKIRCFNPE